jgi:hypothetical protein
LTRGFVLAQRRTEGLADIARRIFQTLCSQPAFLGDFAKPFASLHARFHELVTHSPGRGAHTLASFTERTPLKIRSWENRCSGSSSHQTPHCHGPRLLLHHILRRLFNLIGHST